MKTNLEIYGYNITDDASFMKKQNAVTPELDRQLKNIYNIALKGNPSGIEKILKSIEKHPRNPQLKNHLSVLYNNIGNIEKSREVNRWIVKEHPDYFFGKINLALEYYQKEQYEKMPEILGQTFEIKSLYPERDTFHILEVTAMFKASVFYYSAIGDIEQAETRLNIIKDLDPNSLDYEQASMKLVLGRLKAAFNRQVEGKKKKISVNTSTNYVLQTETAPVFNHPEIEVLYKKGLKIEETTLHQLLLLPRATLIADLEVILQDCISRYHYFLKIENTPEWNEETREFCIHALCLLGELNAKESLQAVLNFLRQDNEFLDFYLADLLTELIWEILYKISNTNLDTLKLFMFEPDIYTYSKTEVSVAVQQIAFHQPNRKQEVIDWFSEVLEFYNNSTTENNIIDSDLIGLIICDVIDLQANELLPMIKQLFDKQYVSTGICGFYKDVVSAMKVHPSKFRKRNLTSIKERYENITGPIVKKSEIDFEKSLEKDFFSNSMNSIKPIKREPKIGRNEPCPCGSGKKYKKCCG